MRNITAILAFCSLLVSTPVWSDDVKYNQTRQIFAEAGASADFFGKSYGYALFPTIGKGGIGIGGAGGRGRVYVNGNHVGNTSMGQITVGLQLGGQAYSMVIFFENERDFISFSRGDFAFGAQATAVAITAGASASSSTTGGGAAGASSSDENATTSGGYSNGMAVFTVAKGGLMYEASIGGAKFSYTPVATAQ